MYSRAFGFADAASGRRADEGTAFYIASSTKALTATAVLALSARKALDLNASLAHYLPALRGRGRLNADSVTLRDLLTMSHGIGEDGGPVAFRAAYSGEFSPDLLLDLLADTGSQARRGRSGTAILATTSSASCWIRGKATAGRTSCGARSWSRSACERRARACLTSRPA